MAPMSSALNTTGTRLEFVDRLRGYRFAAELRRSGGSPKVGVWHTHQAVVVDLANRHPSEAALAMYQAARGAAA